MKTKKMHNLNDEMEKWVKLKDVLELIDEVLAAERCGFYHVQQLRDKINRETTG